MVFSLDSNDYAWSIDWHPISAVLNYGSNLYPVLGTEFNMSVSY